jgi:hypothetical protein
MLSEATRLYGPDHPQHHASSSIRARPPPPINGRVAAGGAGDRDLVLVSDVDEIPAPHVVCSFTPPFHG